MIDPDAISLFLEDKGVAHYLLMDREGRVLDHKMQNPEETSRRLFLCFRHLLAVGKKNFRHAVFSMDDHTAVVLFFLNDSLLAVVTDQDSHNLVRYLEQLTRS